MKYHYEKEKNAHKNMDNTYYCNHPLYNKCTLYLLGNKGLAVIQQRFNEKLKSSWWSEIDPELVDEIFYNPGFVDYFDKNAAGKDRDGLYPTVTVRQIMWGLRMKPLPKEFWETRFG